MLSAYRTLPPRAPSKYGFWEERSQRSLSVRLGFSAQRWGLRTKMPVKPLHFREKDFEEIRAACVALDFECTFAYPDDDFYVVDRKTGKCFSLPPRLLDDIIARRCLKCKAGPGERCDAGLHS